MLIRPLILASLLSTSALANGSLLAPGPSDLWKKATLHNPTISEARARFEAAKRLSEGSNHIFLPDVTLSSTLLQRESTDNRQGTESRGPLVEEEGLHTLALSQNIFNREAWIIREESRVNVEIAEAQLHLAETKIRHSILTLYWEILSLKESLDLLEESLNGPLAVLEQQAQAAISSGVRSTIDLNTYLMQISTLKIQFLRLKADFDDKQEQLSLLIGDSLPTLRPRKPEYSISRIPSIDHWSPSQLRIENLNLKLEHLGVESATARFLPTLTLNANRQSFVTLTRQDAMKSRNSRDSTELSLSLNVSLFSGLSDFRQRQAKKVLAMAAETRRNALQKRTDTRSNSSSSRLKQAQERFLSTLALQSSAETLEKNILTRHEAGLASFDLVIGPRVQALNMRLTLVDTLYEYLIIEANEYAEAGSLDEQIIERLEKEVLVSP